MFIAWEDQLDNETFREVELEQAVNEAVCQEAYERMAEREWLKSQQTGNVN